MLVAQSKGEEFEPSMLQFQKRAAELNEMHNQRSKGEREALVRDVAWWVLFTWSYLVLS